MTDMAQRNRAQRRVRVSSGDTVFHVLNWIFLSFMLVVVLFPLLNVVSSSLSAPAAVGSGRVFLWPVGFSLNAYSMLFREQQLMTGLYNTIIYTVAGTCLNIVITVMCAYPLSRADLVGRRPVMFLFTFTMLFSGGMIPNYFLIKSLGLINNRLVMILPQAMSVYNMIVARTFFINTIPRELNEAAEIDGATDFQLIRKVILPLSTPILAVLTLFYAQTHWNAFFDAFLYLTEPRLFSLQLVLRNYISNIKMMMDTSGTTNSIAEAQEIALFQEVVKYAVIVFSSIPIVLVYPFAQKYFIKGVMIGSIKG